jgi:hypothetical protein
MQVYGAHYAYVLVVNDKGGKLFYYDLNHPSSKDYWEEVSCTSYYLTNSICHRPLFLVLHFSWEAMQPMDYLKPVA